MSTIKASNIQNGSSSSVNIALNTDGSATFAQMPVGPSSFLRNRLINGDMRINQRASTISASGYSVDRWSLGVSTSGAWTAAQSTVAPPNFVNSLLFTKTTGGTPASGDTNYVFQGIEGFNISDFGWGTAAAKTVTLSFWVYAGATGTFGGSLRNGSATYYAYPFTYSIPVANTWTYVTVTVPGPTSGSWPTDNSFAGTVFFDLGSGSSARATAGSWQTGNFVGATGTTTYPTSTSGGTFYVTGVQLEIGSVATPFERRQYTTELQLCQRYFLQWTGTSAANGFPGIANGIASGATSGTITLITPVTMRATPSLSFSGTLNIYDGSTSIVLTSIGTIYLVSPSMFWFVANGTGSSLTAGRGLLLYAQNAATNFFRADAEF